MKVLGSVLVIVGCGGVGFAMAQTRRQLERAMEQLLGALEWMALELNCRMPPLSVLCADAAEAIGGVVGQVLRRLAQELDAQIIPDVASCVAAAIAATPRLPSHVAAHFTRLGKKLGKFDLEEQIALLHSAADGCRQDLEQIRARHKLNLRNYQTLGFCAGVVLVLLFL